MRLGQHFLVNKSKIRKIVEALNLKSGDTVVEIGAGHGELTKEIIQKFRNQEIKKFKIVAIERDGRLAQALFRVIVDTNAEVIEGDALKLLPSLISNYQLPITNYKIVGNIPYYITGHLLRVIGELKKKPALIVLTIQKEVAERVSAKPPQMNLLSASVQFWANPEIIGYISKKDFRPQPKVDSAIIRLLPHSITNYQLPVANYYRLIKVVFKQPRKTVWNNIKNEILNINNKEEAAQLLKKVGVNPGDRPQNLSVDQLIELSGLTFPLLFHKFSLYNSSDAQEKN